MDKAVIDNLKANQWIMFVSKQSNVSEGEPSFGLMMIGVARPDISNDSTPQMFLLTPFFITNVSLPFVTGYFLHTNRTPMTFPVYKYDIYNVPRQISEQYKENWVSGICNNVTPIELLKMLPFLPDWFIRSKTYKKVEALYYEEEQQSKNIRNNKR